MQNTVNHGIEQHRSIFPGDRKVIQENDRITNSSNHRGWRARMSYKHQINIFSQLDCLSIQHGLTQKLNIVRNCNT